GALGLDHLDGAFDRGPDRLLFQIRVEDDHDLVRPHGPDLLRTVAPATGDRLTPDRDVPAWGDGRRNAIEPVRLAVARRCGSIETGRYNAPVTLYEGLTRFTRSLRAGIPGTRAFARRRAPSARSARLRVPRAGRLRGGT